VIDQRPESRDPGAAPDAPLSVLRNIERKIGGLFEGVFSRTFRSGVQPVELARKLAKEMDDHRTISIHRVYVPNEYTVYLAPADREQFAGYEEQMRDELAEYLLEHARREGYTLTTRPLVLLESEPELSLGEFGIAVASGAGPDEADEPAPAFAAAPPPAPAGPPAGSATMVYVPEREELPEPVPVAERATLEWTGGSLELRGEVTRIGRSSESDLRLDDPNVSRHHAEIRRIGAAYSLVDLDSTNGTEVNGQRIRETSLMSGDVIGVGTTRITFERSGG
jgi:Protein of unknown function (DUF3662)/FHA domain